MLPLTPNSADIAAIRANVQRSIDAFEAGNTAEGIQAAAQATAVATVSALAFAWATGNRFPVQGLDLVFNSLSKSPPLWGKLLQEAGIITSPLMASKFGNFMAGITAGASAGYLTDEAIDWINRQGLGSRFYDFLHGEEVSALTATAFSHAKSIPFFRSDPLTLDLDGDGLETTGINTADPILFDHNADGIRTATGWVLADDALLVLDRNGNGVIDNGTELFGDSTPLNFGGNAADGFAALAQEDTNADGLVDSSDANFSELRLWRDLNQDGISQAEELFTLDSQNVAALIVAKTENAVVLANGNQIADLGGFLRSDGSNGTLGAAEQLADIDLISNPFYSEFTDHITITSAAQALPDMGGAGQVRDLREAASLQTPEGAALANLLTAFSLEPTRAGQLAMMNELLDAWSETSTMTTSAMILRLPVLGGGNGNGGGGTAPPPTPEQIAYEARLDQLEVLERFNGQTFITNPQPGGRITFFPANTALLDQSYQALTDSVYSSLVLQTRLKPYLDAIELRIDESGIGLDYTAMMAKFPVNDSSWVAAA